MNLSAATQKGWLMPKALCLIGMVIAVLVFLIFLIDLVAGVAGMIEMAPFRCPSVMLDVIFLISSGALAYMSWATFRELK